MAKGNIQAFSYKNVSGTGNTQVCATDGILGGIFVNSGTAVTVAFYDGTSTSGPVIIATAQLAVGWNPMPFALSTGLFMVLGGTTPNVTVAYLS